MQTRHGLAVLALLAAIAAPPLHAQDGDTPGGSNRDTLRVPAVRMLEVENAVPGWECPMPVAGLAAADPSAPSGMPVVPIDSAAAVPMPTVRRHCLNPLAMSTPAGPGLQLPIPGDPRRLPAPDSLLVAPPDPSDPD